MKTGKSTHMFSADRPITSERQDLLGRAAFSKRLAEAIGGWRGSDSLVVALYGPWGIGKTSIKNMVLEALGESSDPIHTVEFNPWQWSGHEQVAQGFFSDLARVLGRGPDAREARKREKAWRAYAARLGVPLYISDRIRTLITWVLGATGVASVAAPWLGKILPTPIGDVSLVVIGLALIVFAGLVRFAKGLSESIASSAAAQASLLDERTLTEHKADIRALLSKLDKPVLVVVDDIDRLQPAEIRLLFQLVKANADFPSLTYLLLFQRDIVERAFADTEDAGHGKAFLEKIVQVGFDVPQLQPSHVHQALIDGLNHILQEEAIARRFDQGYWHTIFIELHRFFKNLRDVARFLGSLEFHSALFLNRNSFEVNPVDLIALEVLRLFEPAFYARIKESKTLLTSASSALASRRDGKSDGAALETMLRTSSPERAEATKALMSEIFPSVKSLLGGPSYSNGFSEEWFRTSRVCHEDVFNRYFQLALTDGDISQSDLDYFKENADHRERVAGRLREFILTGRIGTLLHCLEAFKQTLSPAQVEPFITAMMDIGDLLPKGAPGIFAISPDMHASRFVYWALKTIKDKDERAEVFRNACANTQGILLPLREVARDTKSSEDEEFLSDEDLGVCRAALLERIRDRATSDLHMVSFLPGLLSFWKEWGEPNEVHDWAIQLLQTPGGAASLLSSFVGERTSTPMFGRGPTKVHHYIQLKFLREYVNVEDIDEALNNADTEAMTDPERTAVEAFREAKRREAEGKPDDPGLFGDD